MRIVSVEFALLLAIALVAPAGDSRSPKNPIRFVDVTKAAGLYEPLAGIMGHGGAWGDFDGDGFPDLFVGGFCDRPNSEYAPAKGPVPNRLFRNNRDGTFSLVKTPGLDVYGRASGAVFADLNNDGWLELYVANNTKGKTNKTEEPQRSAQLRHVQLFRNDKGKLIDISADSGACPKTMRTARNIGVFDYDGDGLLDLFVVEDMFIKNPKPRSALFRNKGNLKFEDVTKEAGLPEDIFGLGLAVADLNGDGRPDVFVAHSNRLFLSQPDGKYREAVELRDVFGWKPLDREDWPCGAVFGDLNRDGRLDLVLTIHGKNARNKVFLNMGLKDGIPQFKDVTKEVGLGDVVPVKCPHVEIQDFDNDGWPDIYISAGWLENDTFTPLIYRNEGIKEGLPRFVPPRPIQGPMVYFPAGPTADYDHDGRLDIFLINWFQGNHCRLLKNDSPKRHWLDVQVVGKKKLNRMGIGAQVRVFKTGQMDQAAGLLGFQEVTTGYGYASGQPAICHFGLGDIKSVDVSVRLPDGRLINSKNVAADRRIVIEEP
jgi:enediyne biosynthesis protein E4